MRQVEEGHPAGHVALGDRHHQAQVGLDQLGPGDVEVELDPAKEVVALTLGLRPVFRGDRLASDALAAQVLFGVGLVLADPDHGFDDLPVPPAVDLPRDRGRPLDLDADLPGLDPHGQVDFLGRGEERDPPDVLQVHPYRVVARGLQLLGAREPRAGAVARLLARHLDDLDPLLAEVVLEPGEELLDLFGGEVVVREHLQQVVGCDEPALAAPVGNGFARVF